MRQVATYTVSMLIGATIFLLWLVVPVDPVQAAGLVPCDGANCNFCHVVQLGNNVLNLIFGAVFVIFTILMFVAGIGLVTSGGNQSRLEDAKSKLTNGILGVLVVFSAWLIVDTLLKATLTFDDDDNFVVGSANLGPWNEIECSGGQNTPSAAGDGCSPLLLMATYGGSPQNTNHPALQGMIDCYTADPLVAGALDWSQIYTYELTEPRCQLTNGTPVGTCGIFACAHSVNSCHYGRGSGDGAMAADFNATGPPGPTLQEMSLNSFLVDRQPACGGIILFEDDHTHISLPGC